MNIAELVVLKVTKGIQDSILLKYIKGGYLYIKDKGEKKGIIKIIISLQLS